MTPMEITRSMVQTGFSPRIQDSHKGTYGNILSFCGSYGMAGAAFFAASAALRCGAGLVTAALPESIYPLVGSRLPEAVFLPLPEQQHKLTAGAETLLVDSSPRFSAAVVGCGLGQSEEIGHCLSAFFRHRNGLPTVLDADGLNWLSRFMPDTPYFLGDAAPQNLCVTPHPAEMARLLETTPAVIQEDRVRAAETLAETLHAVVVLKGHRTVIAAEGFPTLINPTGCSGMATGGTGDLLAGMIASLCGQGMSLYNAAISGVYLHGLAGELASENLSEHGMLPSDMLRQIPLLFRDFE